mmetsp:Transcript_15318/g.38984  ORF Transcript_15318/g.38984 Transcript_15318/m.38984 type:complete len:526 (-) Transcript_15318:1010-2587(-)
MVDIPGLRSIKWTQSYWGHGFTRRKLRAVWFIVVTLSVGALVPFAIFSFLQDHTSARTAILVLGSIFTSLAIPTTLYGIWQHISNYTQPLLQRYIIRILWMVPIYALDAWVVLILTATCLAKYAYIPNLFRQVYEAYTLYNFFSYLLMYLETTSGMTAGELLREKETNTADASGEGEPAVEDTKIVSVVPSSLLYHPGRTWVEHLPPFRFTFRGRTVELLAPWERGEPFVSNCKWGVMSYVVISPVSFLVSLTYETVRSSEGDSFMSNYTSAYFWFTVLETWISFWAVYCFVFFFYEAQNELKPMKPLGKFLSVKGIVFVTFWQNIMLQCLSSFWKVKKGSIYDKDHGLWNCRYNKYHVTEALNSFFFSIEMLILSFAFAISFPSNEFRVPMAEQEHSPASNVSSDHQGDLRPKIRALFDVNDVKDDLLMHLRPTTRVIEDSRDNVFRGLKQGARLLGVFFMRLFGYDLGNSATVAYSYLPRRRKGGYSSRAYTAPEVPSHAQDCLSPDAFSDCSSVHHQPGLET